MSGHKVIADELHDSAWLEEQTLAPSDSSERQGRTAFVVAAMLVISSGLGLLRDLSLAGLFGASSDTDAFLVAWTIPETVTVLLMEGALSFLLVPVFVRELQRADSISRVVRATLLPLMAALVLLTGVAVVAAPLLVDLIAPGITSQALAVRSFRVAAFTVIAMGLAGYLMAALRANRSFVRPATTYVAYNIGILGTMYALHRPLGVFSAALGLAVGSALMVLVLVPGFLRVTSLSGLRLAVDRRVLFAAAGFVPIGAYSMGRQAQVFVERIVGSTLDPGSISYMNYASKVAQMPALLAVTAATVAFPALARIAADRHEFSGRVVAEARTVILLIMPSIAFLVIFAEPCVRLLFERGAFSPRDTAATAEVMRIYSLGLLGQALVGLGALVLFSVGSYIWTPAISAVCGLALTIALDVSLAPSLQVSALAVGNAAGISCAAVIMWVGIRRHVTYSAGTVTSLLLVLAPVSLAAAASALLVCRLLSLNVTGEVFVGGVVTLALFLLLTAASGVPESRAVVRAMRHASGRAADRLSRVRR